MLAGRLPGRIRPDLSGSADVRAEPDHADVRAEPDHADERAERNHADHGSETAVALPRRRDIIEA
jgi:hypothetical protein